MLEAVWTVRFQSQHDYGAGVVILDTQKVYGGDDQYLYVGTYTYDQKTDRMSARVLVRRHNYVPGRGSVFGDLERYTLALSGTPARDEMILTGVLVDPPTSQPIRIKLTRAEELPNPGLR